MNNTNAGFHRIARNSVFIAIAAMASAGTWAQDTTTTTIQHGVPSFNTEVRNAQVVYVEGNDLVLKLETGKLEHLVVPDSDKFTIDGKDVTVHELTPGTKLSQSITTTSAPRFVTTVRTLKGKVWHVSAPHSVIVSLPDHTNQTFTVPKNAEFTVNGKPKSVYDLKKGMNFEATIVTDSSETVMSQNKSITGTAPAPATIPLLGVLLFRRPAPEAAASPVTEASAEPPAESLPKTGSEVPLMGLLGGLALAGSFGLKAVRQKFTN
ncbi:MAG: LPXTG cell wall anchor domain-containing protein [Terracidiphilus sp.]|jgi:LPXTG-motif cell wall-anchored protein